MRRRYFHFDGGPLDGANLSIPAIAEQAVEVRIVFAGQSRQDEPGVLRELRAHSYVIADCTEVESANGEKHTTHHLIYEGAKRERTDGPAGLIGFG